MYELFDEYRWDKAWKRLTHNEHGIEGLGNIAHVNLDCAIAPVPPHYHAGIFEFHCIVKGKRISKIGSSEYTTMGNELIFTFPNEQHSTGALPQCPVEFYSFQINTSDSDHILGLNREYSNRLFRLLKGLRDRHLKMRNMDMQMLKDCFQSLTGSTSDPYLGVQYLTCFLFRLPEMEHAASNSSRGMTPALQKTIDYIDANFRESISLQDMADISGYSPSRFKTLFKETFGIPPAEFVAFRKMEYAKEKLAGSDEPITSIAYELNFSSSNYFSSVFRKFVGYNPSDFRKIYGEPK